MEQSTTIAARYAEVRERVRGACQRTGRDPETVHIVAVTKAHPPELIAQARLAGLTFFGENYAQEMRDKRSAIGPAPGPDEEWHYIGRLQKNKVRLMVGEQQVALIHSLDDVAVAEEISRRAAPHPQPVLLQVNVAREPGKGGVLPEAVPAALDSLRRLPGIALRGLMTVPPFADTAEESRAHFSTLAATLTKVRADHGLDPSFAELSMGMSHDFEIAVECGATLLRLGTVLFGERPARRWQLNQRSAQ